MNEIGNELVYKIEVPYNHPVLVKRRKKASIGIGVFLLIMSLFWLLPIYFSATSENLELWVVMLFVAFWVLTVAVAIYFFVSIKPNKKNDNKKIVLDFYEYNLHVYEISSKKTRDLTICLYREYKNRQYVKNIIDENGVVTIKVYTGTYNGVPKYAFYHIPKDILGSVKLCGLIKFLVDRVGQDYKVKNKL